MKATRKARQDVVDPKFKAKSLLSDNGKKNIMTFGEMDELDIPEPEYVLPGLPRRALGLFQAVTHCGKTTAMVNICIRVAAGLPFPPLWEESIPRTVAYWDWETPIEEARRDLRKMMSPLTTEERELVRKNFYCYHFISDLTQEIRLSDPVGYEMAVMRLEEIRPDLIVIDPVSAAFPGVEEQENTEVSELIIAPANNLARRTGAAVMLVHHIGKEKSEEGKTRLDVYRSRGASAFGAGARLIMQLDFKQTYGEEYRELSFPKVKGGVLPTIRTEFDPATMWITAEGTQAVESEVNYAMIVDFINADDNEVSRKELVAAFNGRIGSEATLDRILKRAVYQGDVQKVKNRYGYYAQATKE